jgi:SAM-dependent methyltransferase
MDEKDFQMQSAQSSRDVLAFYDRYAKTWDKRFGGHKLSTMQFHRIRFESFLQVADFKKTDRVIELGVGTGPYLEEILPLVREVICIDGSEQMLDLLREKHGDHPNIQLFQMDLEKPIKRLPFQADLVYWFGLIEHIIDVNSFILNCKSMLRIGGRVAFIAVNGRCPWYSGISRFWRAGRHCSSDTYYTKEQLDHLMISHGFAPEATIYWGYFPAAIGDTLYHILNLIGKVVERTWLKHYAGGLTLSYVFKGEKQAAAI